MGRGGIPEKGTLETLGWGIKKHLRQREHMDWSSGRMEYGTCENCPQMETVSLEQGEAEEVHGIQTIHELYIMEENVSKHIFKLQKLRPFVHIKLDTKQGSKTS